jgi:hypothetical protein
MTKIHVLASVSLAVGLLTACGGGSNDYAANTPPNVAGTDVPVAATTGATAVISFAQDQLAKTSEASDPLSLGDAMLAVDDTAEPAPV